MTELQPQLDESQKRLNDMTQEKRVSNWLKAYPVEWSRVLSQQETIFGTVFVYVMTGD